MKAVVIGFVLVQLQLAYLANAQIIISSYPSPLHVRVTRTFTIACNFRDNTFVSWQHPSQGIITQSTGHITLQVISGGAVAQLIVGNPMFNRDEGPYTCHVRTSSGQQISRTVHAELYNGTVITTQNYLVYTALQGDTAPVEVPCASMYHDELAWRKVPHPRVLRNTSDGHLVIQPDTGSMIINNVRFSDNGSYECTVRNRVSQVSLIASVVVHVSASVTATPVSSTVAEGSMAEFTFTVTGNPLPTVEWYKGTIGDAYRISFSQSQLERSSDSITSTYTLRFSAVRSEDTGTYICQAHNQFGVMSAQVTLQLSDALGPPQQLRVTIVNQTKINVTWSPPDGADMVDSYTVVWRSRIESPRGYPVNGDVLHYVIDQGLTRLTQYTVYVYASNGRGKGSDSQKANVTTDAVAPAAPVGIGVMDIGPTSVRLEWMFGDNGGAPITSISVAAVTLGQDTDFEDMAIESGQTSALISGLKDSHQYVLRLRAKNRIGHGPYLESRVFTTAPPGRPGSPSHVTGTWLSDDQEALVCWEPSEVGQPFLSYTIEVLELKSNVTKIWKLSVDVVMENLSNCTAGYSVTGLEVGVCHRFKVVVSNSQGTGFPSAYSEDFCIPSIEVEGVQSSGERPFLDTEYLIAIAVSLSVVLLMAVGVIFFTWCTCVRVRHNRKTAKFPTGRLPTDRRSSERSNRVLIDPSHEMRFQHQISIGSYTSSGSGNSVSPEETPNTAVSIVSENPFTFDGVVNSRTQQTGFMQPDFPQSTSSSRVHRSGSATLPNVNGSTLYPIPEDQTMPSHTLPYHTTPPHYPGPNEHHMPSYPASYYPTPPSSVGPKIQRSYEEEVEMTDNPLNDEFEKKMLAGGNPSRPNFSHEIDLPEDEPPPYVPPYRGDDMESEMSIPIGESCSQPPRSPQLSFQQQNNSRNRTNHDRYPYSGRDHNIMTPASFNLSSDNEDEDTEFIDNEAYQKVQESQLVGGGGMFGSQNTIHSASSQCSPVVTMERGYGSLQRMIEDDGESTKRFKIGRSARRGEVFEKVELRH